MLSLLTMATLGLGFYALIQTLEYIYSADKLKYSLVVSGFVASGILLLVGCYLMFMFLGLA